MISCRHHICGVAPHYESGISPKEINAMLLPVFCYDNYAISPRRKISKLAEIHDNYCTEILYKGKVL